MAEMVCPHDLTIEGGNPTIAFRHNQATLGSLNFDATDYGHPFGNVVIAVPPMHDQFVVELALAGEALITFDGGELNLRAGRSEERRVGKECDSRCRSRRSPYHSQKNTELNTSTFIVIITLPHI